MDPSRYNALWAAVVLQAQDDIMDLPIKSAEYASAVCFFIHDGQWGEARGAVAEHLDLHPDDLRAFGRRCIAARQDLIAANPTLVKMVPRRELDLPPFLTQFMRSKRGDAR